MILPLCLVLWCSLSALHMGVGTYTYLQSSDTRASRSLSSIISRIGQTSSPYTEPSKYSVCCLFAGPGSANQRMKTLLQIAILGGIGADWIYKSLL